MTIPASRIRSGSVDDDEVRALLKDKRSFIQTFFSIKGINGGIVPFLFNPVQNLYWENQSQRDLVLKSRRHGFSTMKFCQFLTEAITQRCWTSLIVTHNPTSATALFEGLKVAFLSLPEWFRPKTGFDNRYELTFPELDFSRISITTAGKDIFQASGLGRSGNVNSLLCSEFAFWPLPDVSFNAVKECVPVDGEICIETTANGFNAFWKRWRDAKLGFDVFKPHFFPWSLDPKCLLKLLPGEDAMMLNKQSPLRLNQEEVALANKLLEFAPQRVQDKQTYVLQQLKWRRWKMAEMGSDVHLFPREYPLDDKECFLQSGSPFFNPTHVQEAIERDTQKPIKRWANGTAVPAGWKVYELPKAGESYAGGVDVAEGLPTGDYDSVTLINRKTGKVVLHIHGKYGPEGLARQIAHAHVMYDGACFWGIERNQHGATCLSHLIHVEKFPKKFLYHHADWDEISRRTLRRPGWSTDGKSRPIMLDELKTAQSKRHIEVNDDVILQEFLTFVIGATGKAEAQAGANDDTVISTAIAWQMRKHQPFVQKGWQ